MELRVSARFNLHLAKCRLFINTTMMFKLATQLATWRREVTTYTFSQRLLGRPVLVLQREREG